MLCQRCEGLMEVVYVRYQMNEAFSSEVATTRCINCGNIEDSVIRSNRTSATDLLARHSHNYVLRLPVVPHLTNVQIHEDTHIAPSPQPIQRLRRYS